MRRRNIVASAIALSAAAFCGGLAFVLAGVGGDSGIEGRVIVGDGDNVVEGGAPAPGASLVEGRSVSVDRLVNGGASWAVSIALAFRTAITLPMLMGFMALAVPVSRRRRLRSCAPGASGRASASVLS